MTLPFGLTWDAVNPIAAVAALAVVGYEAARFVRTRYAPTPGRRPLGVDPFAPTEEIHRRRAERLAEDNSPVILAAALILAEERERARAADPLSRGKSLVERLREDLPPPGPITAAP